MNEVNSNVLLDIKLENQELNPTVMKSIIDEISASEVKPEELSENGAHIAPSLGEIEGTMLLRVQRVEIVKEEEAQPIQEKNLNTNLMKKDGKERVDDGVVVIPANLKEMELVRDESGLFKCVCCWKVYLVAVFMLKEVSCSWLVLKKSSNFTQF